MPQSAYRAEDGEGGCPRQAAPTRQKGAEAMLLRPSSKLPSLVSVKEVRPWNSLVMQTGSLRNGEPQRYYSHLQRNLQVMQCCEIHDLFRSQIV